MSFNILKFLLPPEEKIFYDLFSQNVDTARDASIKLNEILNSGISDEKIAEIKMLKKSSNETQKLVLQKLNKTFVTPIEPEDIQNIATLLNKITKRIAKVSSNMKVYKLKDVSEDMKEQAKLLVEATNELEFIVKQFRKGHATDEITASNLRIKEIESKGDDILDDATQELFSGKFDTLEVLKLRDIYKDLETALDNCFAVSDKIVNIVLKQN